MSDKLEALPCPFCGAKPNIGLGKVFHCQLHGEPSQAVVVKCNNHDCRAMPKIEGGDIYNGGNEQAREKSVAIWNRRA